MKHSLIAFAIFLGGIQAAFAGDPADPLERQVVNSWSFTSIDEAIALIGKRTGFKVSCPSEIITFYRQLEKQKTDVQHGLGPSCFDSPGESYSAGKYDSGPQKGLPKMTTIREWMNDLCRLNLQMIWKFDREKGALELIVPWRKPDSKSAAELLDYVDKNSWVMSDLNTRIISQEAFDDWQRAFDGLLSKDINYPKAMRVRQRAAYQALAGYDQAFSFPITGTSKEKYTMVIIHHPSPVRPGCDLVSYYWFKKDGTLAGADLMVTGSAIYFFDAEVIDADTSHFGNPSELQVIYKDPDGNKGYCIARFVLEEKGLKLTHLMNGRGEEFPNTARIGQSYLPPDKE